MKKILKYTGFVILLIIGILAINLVIFNKSASKISEGSPIPDYGRHRSALFVVDIQEATTGSISENSTYIDQADELIRMINKLTSAASSSQISVIYIRNEVSNPLINILNNSMAKGSTGAELDKRLTAVSDLIVPKKKNDAFTNPDLDQFLTTMQVNHIYITGLDAAYCVNCTLQGALKRGYKISVVEDAVISAPREQKEEMMQQFRELGVEILSSSEYIASLSSE